MSVDASRIGPYEILEKLGEGGFGIVYKGRHMASGRLAAIKTIRLTQSFSIASIRREVMLLAHLKHPGVVPIYEQGLEEGRPWYAMQFIKGPRLLDYCREHSSDPSTPIRAELTPTPSSGVLLLSDGIVPHPPLPPQNLIPTPTEPSFDPRLLQYESGFSTDPTDFSSLTPVTNLPLPLLSAESLRRILLVSAHLCEVLAFIHAQGVIHRDLKPSNVLLTEEGLPILVDFGLTAFWGGRDVLKTIGGGWGTEAYMCPEQIRGETLDVRADLYSFGCLLYQMLTGRPPFLGESGHLIMQQQLNVPPMPASCLIGGIPPELDELLSRLLRKERQHRLGYAGDVAQQLYRLLGLPSPDASTEELPYLYRPALVGRQDALQELRNRIDQLDLKRGGMLLLGGESGVGKTRLLEEFVRGLSPLGLIQLPGYCLPLGAEQPKTRALAMPLYPLKHPMGLLVDRCLERGIGYTQRLFGNRAPVLLPCFPELANLPGAALFSSPPPLSPEEERRRLLLATMSLLEQLPQEQPVVMLLDDLQWADELTLELLEGLAAHASSAPQRLLVIGTYREEEATEGLLRLTHASGVKRLHLGRLDVPAVASIIRDMLAIQEVPLAFVQQLTRVSAGNPFFISEYLRLGVGEGLIRRTREGQWHLELPSLQAAEAKLDRSVPEALVALIHRRLQALASPHVQLVQAAAVMGRDCPADVLEWLCDQRGWPWVEGLQQLLRRQILEETGTGNLRFIHDKLREAAYELLTKAQRRRLHCAVAEGLERFAEATPPAYGIIGRHWQEGGQLAKASLCYRQDAERARRAKQYREAIRLYRSYLVLSRSRTPERLRVRMDLVKALRTSQGGGEQSTLSLARTNLREARTFPDPNLEGECLAVLADIHMRLRQYRQTRLYCAKAWAIYSRLHDVDGMARTLNSFGGLYFALGQSQLAMKSWHDALQLMRQTGNLSRVRVYLNNIGLIYCREGRLVEAESCFRESYDLCRALGQTVDEAHALMNLCLLHMKNGDLDAALGASQRSLEIMLETDTHRHIPNIMLSHAHLLSLQGLNEQLQPLEAVVQRLASSISEPSNQLILQTVLTLIKQSCGQRDEAERLGREVLTLVQSRQQDRIRAYHFFLLAERREAAGLHDEARERMTEALQQFSELHDWDEACRLILRLAELELNAGLLDEAHTRALTGLELARRVRNRLVELYGLGLLSHITAARGENAQGWRHATLQLSQQVKVAPSCVFLRLR
ncbi:MAG: serine/threonine-protein kinase PknK [Myxococcota bacterium]